MGGVGTGGRGRKHRTKEETVGKKTKDKGRNSGSGGKEQGGKRVMGRVEKKVGCERGGGVGKGIGWA